MYIILLMVVILTTMIIISRMKIKEKPINKYGDNKELILSRRLFELNEHIDFFLETEEKTIYLIQNSEVLEKIIKLYEPIE